MISQVSIIHDDIVVAIGRIEKCEGHGVEVAALNDNAR